MWKNTWRVNTPAVHRMDIPTSVCIRTGLKTQLVRYQLHFFLLDCSEVCGFTYIYLHCRCPFVASWFGTDPPSAAGLYGSAAVKLNHSETFRPALQSAPKHTIRADSEPHSSRIVGRQLTMCTAWLYSSFSAVSPLKRSMSFCLSSRKVCNRRLREWHCVTQVLYNSFSLRITALRKHSMQTFTSH